MVGCTSAGSARERSASPVSPLGSGRCPSWPEEKPPGSRLRSPSGSGWRRWWWPAGKRGTPGGWPRATDRPLDQPALAPGQVSRAACPDGRLQRAPPAAAAHLRAQRPAHRRGARPGLRRADAATSLEIGYGSGLNQPHLPPAVTGVWAVEPSATALRLSEERRAASPVPVVVAGDDAQVLPFPDHRFDAALCTWVLCGLPDAGAALAEVARVLKPGGTPALRRARTGAGSRVVRWQRRGNRINRAIVGVRARQRRPRAAGRLAVDRHGADRALREGRTASRPASCTRGAPRPELTPPGGTARRSPRDRLRPSEVLSMTSSASPAAWLPAALARAAVARRPAGAAGPCRWPPPRPGGPRHRSGSPPPRTSSAPAGTPSRSGAASCTTRAATRSTPSTGSASASTEPSACPRTSASTGTSAANA